MIQNGMYMQTRSSGVSSMYQVTRGDDTDNLPECSLPNSSIEPILTKIDQNLNTFTTNQFQELRDKVRKEGFTNVQADAKNHFGLC